MTHPRDYEVLPKPVKRRRYTCPTRFVIAGLLVALAVSLLLLVRELA